MPPNQALAILQVLELEIAASEDRLATKSDLMDVFHALDLKIETLGERLRGEFRSEIKASEARTARWVLTCTLGQSAMIGAAVYFALTRLR